MEEEHHIEMINGLPWFKWLLQIHNTYYNSLNTRWFNKKITADRETPSHLKYYYKHA